MTDTPVLLNEQSNLIQLAYNLKLKGFAEALQSQFEAPELYQEMSFEQRLEKCLVQQAEVARTRRFNSLYRASLLGRRYFLSQFSPDSRRGLTSEDLTFLNECNYIHKNVNVIISGPTGTGKTSLATAAAVTAMKKGMSSLFYRMSDLAIMLGNMEDRAFLTMKQKFVRVRLLVIDDYGGAKLNDQVVLRLNDLVDARYHEGSTIVTTQLKRAGLKDAMDATAVRDAICDRLFRDSDRYITLTGSSWRGQAGEVKGEK